ncbi:MAG: hypothetical protein R3A52_00730 [Polyangiales bacterium]
MTRSVLRVLLFGAAALGAPLALHGGSLAGLLGLVGAVALACVADERAWPLPVALGALAALTATLFGDSAPLTGAALASSLVWGARARRARGLFGLPTLAGAALASGALAALVAQRYGGHPDVAVRLAALAVAGIVASAPALVPVDDALTAALDAAATRAGGAALLTLSRAAELRRRVVDGEALASLPEASRKRVDGAWASLAATAERRASMEPGAGAAEWLDARVASHLAALERVHAAAEARHARSVAMADQGLADAAVEGEGLEAEVEALRALDETAERPAAASAAN